MNLFVFREAADDNMTIGDDEADDTSADSPEAAVEHMLSGLKQFGAQKSDYRGAQTQATDPRH